MAYAYMPSKLYGTIRALVAISGLQHCFHTEGADATWVCLLEPCIWAGGVCACIKEGPKRGSQSTNKKEKTGSGGIIL